MRARPIRYLKQLYGALPREIYALFAAQVINSVGHFVYPFLTLLLTEKAGYTAAEAGRYILLASVSFIPGSLLGGRISDTLGRKRLIIAAMLAVAAIFTAAGYVHTPAHLPWFLIAAEFCLGMIFPTMTALATDVTTPENRKAAFSLLYLGHNLGFAAGPLIAGFLFNRNYALLFYGDAGTTVVAVLLIALLVRETKPGHREMEEIGVERPQEAADVGTGIMVILRRPSLLVFLMGVLLIQFVYAQFTFTLPLHLQELFGESGASLYGSTMTINALVVVFCTAPLIGLTRKLRPVITVATGAAIYVLGFGALYFASRFSFFVLMAVTWTIGEILTATNIDVFIANHTPASHRGRVNAVVPILFGLGFSVSPALMGDFVDRFSVRQAWPVVGLVAALAAGILLLLAYVERGRPPASPGRCRIVWPLRRGAG
jgi:MFS family permease